MGREGNGGFWRSIFHGSPALLGPWVLFILLPLYLFWSKSSLCAAVLLRRSPAVI
jgi:hypothetical protein